jgi:hypothetical protein
MNSGFESKPSTQPSEPPAGKTAADVLEVFPCASVVAENKPLFCRHCDKDLMPEYAGSLEFRRASKGPGRRAGRRGKIVPIIEVDGTPAWSCHYCGRRVRQ